MVKQGTGCHTSVPNKEKMASLFFIKNVQLAKRKGHAAEEEIKFELPALESNVLDQST